MLIKTSYTTELSVSVSLIYDDSTVKTQKISVGDIINVTYNKNGTRKQIEGKVSRIYLQDGHAGHIGHIASCNNCTNTGCYIIVDGSEYTSADVARIDVDCILDLEMIQKVESINNITSPAGSTAITQFRLMNNQLQLSTDFGNTWLKVLDLPESEIIVDPDYQSLADKIAALIPSCVRPDDKEDAVNELVNLFVDEMKADDPQA